jgi:ribosomal protein S18 acetylase RimI-like enzyme
MNERILYRPATRADIATIAEFQLAMALETEQLALDRATVLAGVTAVFDKPERGYYYVAEDSAAGTSGTVVASLLITREWSDWRNGEVWWLQSVYVDPAARRRGIFAGLYRYVQNLVAENPAIRGLRLYVDQSNSAAQRVYTQLGMNGEHYRVFEWMK